MLGTLGTPELIVIFLLALVLFGPKELPKLGRNLGKALTEFRRASNELKATFDREMKNLEAETKLDEAINPYQYDNYNYDYSSYESAQEGTYGSGTYDATATSPSTPSASAPQGAESPSAVPPQGTVAHGAETVAVQEPSGHTQEPPAAASEHLDHTAEHHA